MKKSIVLLYLLVCYFAKTQAQNSIKGIVIDNHYRKPLQGVVVSLQNTDQKTTIKENGTFILKSIPDGNYTLQLYLTGYETQSFSLELTGKEMDLGTIVFYENMDISEDQDLSVITITDDELNNDDSYADNISGLLQASKDIYLRTAAFEFSAAFFSIRGLGSDHATLLLNGIEMNKLFNGRPQWSNWGGLNDVMRNQEFSTNLSPSGYAFGGILGTTNINTRASEQFPGSKISYASSNRSYAHRMMASYASGLLESNWAYTFSVGRRVGNEGFTNGTFYKATSFFASVEKKVNEKHGIHLTFIYTPNKRGKSSPNTQEVYDLKGIRYNEYWGFQNGEKRNSRVKEVAEPIIMFNHDWKINKKMSLHTNIGYQFGNMANSRIDYTFASNPGAAYYQKLPSYALARNDFESAYEATQNFTKNGQLDWNRIYDANTTNAISETNAAYVIAEDRNDDKQLSVNTIVSYDINDNITFNAKAGFKNLNSENYARIQDLLGGIGDLDIDRFGATENEQQNDLRNRNRVVSVGDKFKYHYNITSKVMNGYAQMQFQYRKTDFFAAARISKTSHQREGLYENGSFPGEASLGKSKRSDFTNMGLKTGATYKINGRHFINFNAGYLTKAPNIRNTFSNVRENNRIVENIDTEKIISTDVSYILRSPAITSKITGYYTGIKDATEISFFFADGLTGNGGDDNAFVQEILTGIDKKHIGLELGIEAQITSTIKLKAAANIGRYTYANNPNLTLTSDAFTDDLVFTANLKGYKLASGPQTAYSAGFEYRSPDYWWFGLTTNFFNNTYIDIAPLTRTENFYLDTDGLPFNDYDPGIAEELLQQEKFDPYSVVNFIGGKSWKIGNYYLGMFASINNILGTEYKTGGFEQGRNANYRTLRDDKTNSIPVFGSKYWYGRGTTYFLNIYLRI